MVNYTEKHYDSDWAKSKSRELVGKFIEETVFTYRKPSEARVVHFGGIDLAESRQVYLPLGFLPKNIISLEREKDIFLEQEKLNKKLGLGIDVRYQDLEEFVNTEKELRLDVVSLDYTGAVDQKQMKALKEISARQQRSSFVLHTANLLRRDKTSNIYYQIGYAVNSSKELSRQEEEIAKGLTHLPGSLAETAARHVALKDRLEKKEPLGGMKLDSYGRIIALGYASFINSIDDIQKLFYFVSGNDRYREISRLSREAESFFGFNGLDEQNLMQFMAGNTVTAIFFSKRIKELLNQKLFNNGFKNETKNNLLGHQLPRLFLRKKTFDVALEQSYSYVSESGSPMVGNIAFLKNPVRTIDKLFEVGRAMNFPKGFEIKDRIEFTRSLDKLYDSYISDVAEKAASFDKVKRNHLFLGNSSKPLLNKKRFINELNRGKKIGEIQSEYRGWSNLPLSQWQAHQVQGNYHETNINGSLSRLTKEEAIERLTKGESPKEIYDAFPGSFKRSQLNALKAWITIRSQAENK